MQILDWKTLTPGEQSRALSRPALANTAELKQKVAQLIERVRDEGDQALIALASELDGAALAEVTASETELADAERRLDPAVSRAIDAAIGNVRQFHSAQQRPALRVETAPGVVCERIVRPIDAVGLYVPAGTAPLPSTAIMLGVPATLAGCPDIVMATPPGANGLADTTVMAVAKKLGIRTVVKAGGAQAIAAMAFGTESVPACAKLFGPGNAWATEAKVQVAAMAGGAAIDMPAGPSELMILADSSADPVFVGADLLSQAEHGVDSQVVLVTTDIETAECVIAELDRQSLRLSRHAIVTESLSHSRCIVVANRDEALAIANNYAPEHLILQMRDPRALLAGVRNAGSVFVGPWTPESVGDYCSGTNHVLPTYGYARSYSGLSLDAFSRTMTVQECSAQGLSAIGPTAITLAQVEGLDAHASAVTARLDTMTTAPKSA